MNSSTSNNRRHLLVAGVLTLLSLALAFSQWLNRMIVDYVGAIGGSIYFERSMALAAATLSCLVSLYVVLLLRAAAKLGTTGEESWPGLPDRGPAVSMVFLFLLAHVLSFARFNQYLAISKSRSGDDWGAVFESFITTSTLDFSVYPADGWNRAAVAWELASMLLLLFLAFPILASRLAVFGDSSQEGQRLAEGSGSGRFIVDICRNDGKPEATAASRGSQKQDDAFRLTLQRRVTCTLAVVNLEGPTQAPPNNPETPTQDPGIKPLPPPEDPSP